MAKLVTCCSDVGEMVCILYLIFSSSDWSSLSRLALLSPLMMVIIGQVKQTLSVSDM